MYNHLPAKVGKRDMNIKPQDKTIKELLLSGRQFVIPRFQREYSWDRKNYKEFLDDMLDCLIVNDGKISYDQYFLGTMLFVGDCFDDDKMEIDVVDGQQRLTTITILFSALSDRFLQLQQDVLSQQMFKYIMTCDDDGNEVRILKSKTHYPFFSFYIQERKKENIQDPSSEEEQCIKASYEYLYSCLNQPQHTELCNSLLHKTMCKQQESITMSIFSGCIEKWYILCYNILTVGVGPAKATV